MLKFPQIVFQNEKASSTASVSLSQKKNWKRSVILMSYSLTSNELMFVALMVIFFLALTEKSRLCKG